MLFVISSSASRFRRAFSYAVLGKKKSAAILAACRSNLLEQNFLGTNPNFALHEIGSQLWLILGDGVNQAADLVSGATSIPSRNLTPLMTFGN